MEAKFETSNAALAFERETRERTGAARHGGKTDAANRLLERKGKVVTYQSTHEGEVRAVGVAALRAQAESVKIYRAKKAARRRAAAKNARIARRRNRG